MYYTVNDSYERRLRGTVTDTLSVTGKVTEIVMETLTEMVSISIRTGLLFDLTRKKEFEDREEFKESENERTTVDDAKVSRRKMIGEVQMSNGTHVTDATHSFGRRLCYLSLNASPTTTEFCGLSNNPLIKRGCS